MGLWEGTKSPLTLGPRYIPTPAPDLMRAIRFAVSSAMSKMTLLLDIGMGGINWAYRKLQSRI